MPGGEGDGGLPKGGETLARAEGGCTFDATVELGTWQRDGAHASRVPRLLGSP
jgi:hypothetical protein